MPELPEVETVVRTLEHQIADAEIMDVEIRYPKVIEMDPNVFKQKLMHQHFRRFSRRGKYLLFYMDDVLLVMHLRMEGKFYIQDASAPKNKHMHVIFKLADHKELRYHDTRKFGRMYLAPLDTDLSQFHDLGPEPFDETFNGAYVYEVSRKRHMPLKTLLLDQSFVAGIGNIYADEILAYCHLRPGRSCNRITKVDADRIAQATKDILHAAIQAGGTTIRSYTSSLGVTGLFQLSCSVHCQKTCKICGSDIHVKRIGGRSSYYCPVCQK